MKRVIVLGALVGLLVGGWALADRKPQTKKPVGGADVLALPANAVSRLVLRAKDGAQTSLGHPSGSVWVPDGEAPDQAASLMLEYEDALFPLRAYKRITADPHNPQYGLTEPDIRMTVEDGKGGSHDLAFGGVSFTGGGNYAHRADDGNVLYLVPKGTVDQLRSLIAGRPVASPRTAREAEVQAELDKDTDTYKSRKPGDPLPALEENPWLGQALEADGGGQP